MPSKVTFNGSTKEITVNPGVSVLDVKEDIYSSWKNWVILNDNSKYLPAVRSIGGDPAGNGFAGDLYFMINSWRVVVNEALSVTGILYSDDYPTPWIVNPSGSVVAAVSYLAYGVSTDGSSSAPSVAEIGDEVTVRLQSVLDVLATLSTEASVQNAIRAAKIAAALSA
jgi:hypothetical protein